MGKRRRQRTLGKCVYCNTAEGITIDHIPPRSLFAKDNRNDLIRVPSCRQCNSGSSFDDEYFRLMMAMRHDVGDIEDARQALESGMRSMSRPDQRGLLQATLRNMEPKSRYQSGLYLGEHPAYNVDLSRLNKVATRIVLGLFWHHMGRPLGDGYGTRVQSVDGFAPGDLDALIGLQKFVAMALKGDGIHRVGGPAFEYWYSSIEDDVDASVWLVRIYQRAHFVGFTLREDDLIRSPRGIVTSRTTVTGNGDYS